MSTVITSDPPDIGTQLNTLVARLVAVEKKAADLETRLAASEAVVSKINVAKLVALQDAARVNNGHLYRLFTESLVFYDFAGNSLISLDVLRNTGSYNKGTALQITSLLKGIGCIAVLIPGDDVPDLHIVSELILNGNHEPNGDTRRLAFVNLGKSGGMVIDSTFTLPTNSVESPIGINIGNLQRVRYEK